MFLIFFINETIKYLFISLFLIILFVLTEISEVILQWMQNILFIYNITKFPAKQTFFLVKLKLFSSKINCDSEIVTKKTLYL